MTSYDGNWGVYPLLGLDRVLLSDIQDGLIVVDATGTAPFLALVPALSYPGITVLVALLAGAGWMFPVGGRQPRIGVI